MTNNRADLAHKFEVVGRFLEIDGVSELLMKTTDTDKKMTVAAYNGIVIQLMGIGMKADKGLMDELVSMNTGKTIDEVQKITDGEYSAQLRLAMLREVFGFFG